MIELYLIKENLIKGYQPSILDISYLLSILSGVFVIITRNPVVSVLFLIGLFISISGYLICVGANLI
jgi:NADH-ubiquinone oxidoreductase chain 6